MLDVATLVGDALLAFATVGAGYAARRTHKNSRVIRRITDAELDRRIHTTVIDVLSTEEGERVRQHLNYLLHRPHDEWME